MITVSFTTISDTTPTRVNGFYRYYHIDGVETGEFSTVLIKNEDGTPDYESTETQIVSVLENQIRI